MNGTRRPRAIWIGTAAVGNIRFVAIARDEPEQQSFAIRGLKFRAVQIKDLDDLYQLAKPVILGAEDE